MRILRTMPTPRLLTLAAAVIAVGAVGAAVAEANLSGRGLPPQKSLARALHDALTAAPVSGISARIAFTNSVLPAGSLTTATPLVSGASGRLWATAGGVRIELQNSSGSGDTEISISHDSIVVYDAAAATAYQLALPRSRTSTHPAGDAAQQLISSILNRVSAWADLAGPARTNIAGQPAYNVRITPRHDGGLLGAAELAFDARHGVPLRIAIYAAGNTQPVLALRVTDITYDPVSASDVAVTLPAGTRRLLIGPPAPTPASARTASEPGTSLAGVEARVGFKLRAPTSLVGLPRVTITTIGGGGHEAALVVYGRGLGAIIIVERRADTAAAATGTLPAVQINGATGSELATALGTLVRVRAGGVEYLIAGSVPPLAAETAARSLLS